MSRDDAGTVVIAAAVFHARVLGHHDLHVIHEVPVPQGLEDRVGKPEGQDVLDRLLAEVVVDAVDLVLREYGVELVIEASGALQVLAEGLLHDDPSPPPGAAVQAGCSEVPHDDREELGRCGEVKEDIPLCSRPHPGFGQEFPQGEI